MFGVYILYVYIARFDSRTLVIVGLARIFCFKVVHVECIARTASAYRLTTCVIIGREFGPEHQTYFGVDSKYDWFVS